MLKISVWCRLALITTAIVLSVLLGACADNNDNNMELDPKAPVEIVVWHYYHGAQKTAFDDAVKEFNETLGYEKGIIVEAENHGGVDELAASVLAAAKGELDAGNMPNIFGSYGETALEVFKMGMVAEIDNYLTPEELSEYEESFIREGMIGMDKLYVFPIAKSTESLMINKTDFDEFVEGLSVLGWEETVDYNSLSTWEGILRVADIYYRYTDALTPDIENDGKGFMGIDSLANYIIIGSKQLGQDLVKVEHGEAVISLDRSIMSKLWYTYYEPMVTGRFVKQGKYCSDDVKTGESLCFIGSTTSSSFFPTELTLDNGEIKDIEMLVLPMPIFEGGDKIAVSQGAGMVIAKSSAKQEYASAIFLKWFTESERNISFSLTSSYLPVKKASLDDALLNAAFNAFEGDEITKQNSIKTLRAGVEQLRTYMLYSCDVFDQGSYFRNTLPVVLSEAVQADRKQYQELLQEGVSPEQAYSELAQQCGAKIDQWISSLTI